MYLSSHKMGQKSSDLLTLCRVSQDRLTGLSIKNKVLIVLYSYTSSSSSSGKEDSSKMSLAGYFESYLNVNVKSKEDLEQKINKVI